MTSTVDFMTGKVGSGKSLHAVFDALRKSIKHDNATIMGNMEIKVKEAVYITPQDIILSLNPKNNIVNEKIALMNDDNYKILILDEIDKWFHSRQHQSKFSVWLSAFITQIRKRNMDLILTAQRPSALDIAGRYAIDNWIRCNAQYYPTPYEKIPYKFKYSKYNEEKGTRKKYTMLARDVEWLYSYYNTKEIIVPADILLQVIA